jgi:hypothetical protein
MTRETQPRPQSAARLSVSLKSVWRCSIRWRRALHGPHTGSSAATGEILPLPFLRYRFCELKYRGAVGRRQVHCTLIIVKIIRFYC